MEQVCPMETKKLEKTASHPDIYAARASAALERKHSSGDLQSRLKTRKILGVGETDNGDVHRSKISQVLGHNEHLFVRFPRCYWLWHISMAVLFTVAGVTQFFSPYAKPDDASQKEVTRPMQMMTSLYGSVLLGFASLLWTFFGTTDKAVARRLMSAIVVAMLAQLFALLSFAYQNNIWDNKAQTDISIRLFLLLGCAYYFWAIGSSRAGLRRSLSNKDLRDDPSPTSPNPRHEKKLE